MDHHLLNEYRNRLIVEHNIQKIKIISHVTTIALLLFLTIEFSYIIIMKQDFLRIDWLPYTIIIGVNVGWHMYIKMFERQHAEAEAFYTAKRHTLANIYIYSMLIAGAFVTLSSSVVFNNFMVYTLILLVCSSYFVLKKHEIFIPMTIASVIILAGFYFSKGFHNEFIIEFVYISVLNPIAYVVSRSYSNSTEKAIRMQIRLLMEKEERKKVMKKLRDVNRQLEVQASQDPLTKIYNRRAVNEYMAQLSTQAKKSAFALSTIILDIDYFKQYNDKYGHLQGDEVLIKVGQVLHDIGEEHHVFTARWGGEEFMVLIINANEYKLQAVCEDIINKVDQLAIEHIASEVSDRITVSIGAHSVLVNEPQQVLQSINYADITLYDVKNNGRNGYAIRMAVG